VGRPDIGRSEAATNSAEEAGGVSIAADDASAPSRPPSRPPSPREVELFHALYREHFDFVFRNLRRLGVQPSQVDDAVQDAFLVALRHIAKCEAPAQGKAWLFAIALRVARNYRRTERRKGGLMPLEADAVASAGERDPFEHTAATQATRQLRAFLDSLDEDKRSVFIMTELEQLSAPEISAVLGVNLNTVYARVRAARREFARAIECFQLRESDDGSG
jgi:RNA polymerase sigma-70 factor (ECF subfamily)